MVVTYCVASPRGPPVRGLLMILTCLYVATTSQQATSPPWATPPPLIAATTDTMAPLVITYRMPILTEHTNILHTSRILLSVDANRYYRQQMSDTSEECRILTY